MWLFGKKKELNDEELAWRYYDTGDKSFVGLLFEKHVKTVYGVCLFYFRNKAEAEDVCMQIFEKLIWELKKSRINNFKAWLSFVVRNHCLNELRTKKGKYFVPEHYLDFEMRETTLEEEEKVARVKEERLLEKLKGLLPKLKEKQKTCVERFYLMQQSYEDISRDTGFSMNEVKSYIQNGKRNLKLMLEDQNNKNNNAA